MGAGTSCAPILGPGWAWGQDRRRRIVVVARRSLTVEERSFQVKLEPEVVGDGDRLLVRPPAPAPSGLDDLAKTASEICVLLACASRARTDRSREHRPTK